MLLLLRYDLQSLAQPKPSESTQQSSRFQGLHGAMSQAWHHMYQQGDAQHLGQ